MMKKVGLCLLVFLTISFYCQGQASILLKFKPVFGKAVLNTNINILRLEDSLQIESLQFYVSGIRLMNAGKIIFEEQNSFHLLNILNAQSLEISLPISRDLIFDQVVFNLGIDSITNVSGAFGGDLDPSKGMYWTWQSGYINLKLEGKSKDFNGRNGHFSFHLGGYAGELNALQTVEISAKPTEVLNIEMDIKKLFSILDLKTQKNIMSPSAETVKISKELAKIFSLR